MTRSGHRKFAIPDALAVAVAGLRRHADQGAAPTPECRTASRLRASPSLPVPLYSYSSCPPDGRTGNYSDALHFLFLDLDFDLGLLRDLFGAN